MIRHFLISPAGRSSDSSKSIGKSFYKPFSPIVPVGLHRTELHVQPQEALLDEKQTAS
jgi:hypothetical protein